MRFEELPATPDEFFVCAIELGAHLGNEALVQKASSRTGELRGDYQLRCANALRSVGLSDLAAERRMLALTRITSYQGVLEWIYHLDNAGRRSDLDWLLDNVEN